MERLTAEQVTFRLGTGTALELVPTFAMGRQVELGLGTFGVVPWVAANAQPAQQQCSHVAHVCFTASSSARVWGRMSRLGSVYCLAVT